MALAVTAAASTRARSRSVDVAISSRRFARAARKANGDFRAHRGRGHHTIEFEDSDCVMKLDAPRNDGKPVVHFRCGLLHVRRDVADASSLLERVRVSEPSAAERDARLRVIVPRVDVNAPDQVLRKRDPRITSRARPRSRISTPTFATMPCAACRRSRIITLRQSVIHRLLAAPRRKPAAPEDPLRSRRGRRIKDVASAAAGDDCSTHRRRLSPP